MEATWWTTPEQLDADQRKVVALQTAGNHLVLGPPGSGKTNLLILRAAYLHRANIHDTAVLTFGRVLREFLAAGTENYPFAGSKIQTYVRWAFGILSEHGVRFNEEGDLRQIRARLASELEKLIARGQLEHRYDRILIDEVQDYSAVEIGLIRHFAKYIFAVGDDRQRIFETDGAIASLESFCEVTRLRYHYRNGIQICRVADGIRDLVDAPEGLEAGSQYNEAEYPSSVHSFPGLEIPQQVDAAVTEIKTQLRAYPDGVIGILCPRHEELSQVWAHLERSSISQHVQIQRLSGGYEAFDLDKRVIVTTLHSAKGLEFRAVHLLGMDKICRFRDAQKRMSYTGITRAKTSLAIYHEGSLPGYLERGLAAVGPHGTLPSLDDLFG